MKLQAVLKSVLLWSYERGTWQYDVLCLLILAFIFLTPSSWFAHSGADSSIPHKVPQHETRASSSPEADAPTLPAEKTSPAPPCDR